MKNEVSVLIANAEPLGDGYTKVLTHDFESLEEALSKARTKRERQLILPTIHLNGTSKHELQEQIETACMAVRDAMAAFRCASPNGRDYYLQGPNIFTLAVAQHQEQFNKLNEVKTYLECIAEGIA